MSLPGEPAKSSSHFHCLKCDYFCTDTNKVVAHRRQHQKMDSIAAAGFEKYTPAQQCAGVGATEPPAPAPDGGAAGAAGMAGASGAVVAMAEGQCPHAGRQTHYHCTRCQYAVLGLSQMEAHKFRHASE